MKSSLEELLKRTVEHYKSLTQAQKDEMWRLQKESWIRGMAPCEHGIRDWETCPDCLEKYKDN
jgi:hypothetical protein